MADTRHSLKYFLEEVEEAEEAEEVVEEAVEEVAEEAVEEAVGPAVPLADVLVSAAAPERWACLHPRKLV